MKLKDSHPELFVDVPEGSVLESCEGDGVNPDVISVIWRTPSGETLVRFVHRAEGNN